MWQRSTFDSARPIPCRRHDGTAFTLTELVIVLVVIVGLALLILPVMSTGHAQPNKAKCLSNQKLIAFAIMEYIQDYDEVMPPVVGARKVGTHVYPANWLGDRTATDGTVVPGLLTDYLKFDMPGLLRCPEMPQSKQLTYRYNDLLAALPVKYLTGPSFTVLVMDGEDLPVNAGHSGPEDIIAQDCVPAASGNCAPGHGATIRTAVPGRHDTNGPGANYAFADGHCRWFKAGSVYYPPRASSDRRHHAGEPDPAQGAAQKGGTYAGTFHVR